MALSEYATVEELKELVEKHPDLEVTRDDSLAAGNCESGTDDFIEGCLGGRTTVKVSELAPYIVDYLGVRGVLIHKFSQLEEQSAEESAAQSTDTSEDEPPF